MKYIFLIILSMFFYMISFYVPQQWQYLYGYFSGTVTFLMYAYLDIKLTIKES